MENEPGISGIRFGMEASQEDGMVLKRARQTPNGPLHNCGAHNLCGNNFLWRTSGSAMVGPKEYGLQWSSPIGPYIDFKG